MSQGLSHQDFIVATDVAVLGIAPSTAPSTFGSAVNMLGTAKKVEITLPERNEVDVSPSADQFDSVRHDKFKKGSYTITGFDQMISNQYLAVFIASGFGQLAYQDATTGQVMQLTISIPKYSTSWGSGPNESTISGSVLGFPYAAQDGSTAASVSL